MRLALIGDVHIYQLGLWPWDLLGKRALGQLNLWLHRRLKFDPALLEPLVQHLKDAEPDHILCSGDLTTTALHGEFRRAARLLEQLHHVATLSLVRGNHDCYTFTAHRRKRFERLLAHWRLDLEGPRQLTERWALIGLESTVPRLLSSRGRVEQGQLQRLRHVAREHARRCGDDAGLLVLCHYPFALPKRAGRWRWTHRLQNADELERTLRRLPGRVLFCHGHVHQPWVWRLSERLIDLNAGAPCHRAGDYPDGQGFWTIELDEPPRPQADRPAPHRAEHAKSHAAAQATGGDLDPRERTAPTGGQPETDPETDQDSGRRANDIGTPFAHPSPSPSPTFTFHPLDGHSEPWRIDQPHEDSG